MNLTILAKIVALAYAGAMDSLSLSAVCAVGHSAEDPAIKATFGVAHSATSAALAVALASFGATESTMVPHYEGESVAGSLARVYGPRTIGLTGAAF
jgi:hypothetical protein